MNVPFKNVAGQGIEIEEISQLITKFDPVKNTFCETI